jgi:phosphoribosylformimino-5-aminoimidazole carboxamide ribotide isomerase
MEGLETKELQENSFIIPAIDIIDGKCVRLTKGDFSAKKIYNENPLEVALQFQASGFNRLHLVDLDGAKAGSVKNWKVLESITSKTNLAIDFGGGLKSEKDLEIVFNSGARWATVGSIAVENEPEFSNWIETYGPEKFLLGADVKGQNVAIKGWVEISTISVFDLVEKYSAKGIKQIFCTDIAKDGMLQGPAIELYRQIIEKFPSIELIASGGVSSIEDVIQLKKIGCSGIIIGKALYEGLLSIPELININQTS